MQGMHQNELLRSPKVLLVNSTMRWSGNKICKCGRTISMNKNSCLGCSKEIDNGKIS